MKEVKLDVKYYDYDRFRSIEPLTKFEDIKIGETYHIPPTILYGRRDITVESKTTTTITGNVKYYDGSENTHSTLYRTEISMKFIVKKQ